MSGGFGSVLAVSSKCWYRCWYQQRLTDSLIRSAKADGKPVKLSDGGGLYLMVMPQGGKYWRYAYRFVGKQKTLALGTFPDIRLALPRGFRGVASTIADS
ncbi:Arm DNA-binding domain-containing protein [Pusillimonas sp. SM2304]|uniref:Arm DNA-binding domain-containing protein n=1 Tax=Pusillimonas sp. SM2304 TaxID=3073241 RepID=UPI0038F71B77